MAQMAENGLFRQVLRRCNAGSVMIQSGLGEGKGLQMLRLLSSNLPGCIYSILDCGLAFLSHRYRPVALGRTRVVKLKCLLADFAADESGATAIEYGLIAAGIALAIIEIIYALGTNLVAKLQSLATALK